jgi:hypothetical protein
MESEVTANLPYKIDIFLLDNVLRGMTKIAKL